MPSIQPNHLLVRLTDNNTTKQKATSVLDVVSSHGTDAAKFIKNLSLTLAGTGIIGFAGVGKSIAPDHTFFDKFSLVGIFIGAITAIWGGIGLYRGNQQIKQSELPLTPITIKDSTASEISDIVKEISSNPNDTFQFSNDVVNGNRAAGLRDHCNDLILKWTEPTTGMIDVINSNKSRTEFLFEHGNGTNSHITSQELKERIAILIGHVVGSRANATLDAESQHLVVDMLCLDQIENPNDWGTCELERLVPDEFTLLYTAARHYKLNHMDRDDSITDDSLILRDPGGGGTQTILATDTVTALSSTTRDPAKEDAKVDAGRVVNSRNYLRTLQKGIEFVTQVEREKKSGGTVDATRQRDADVLRNALVAGLGLKVDDLEDTLTQLDNILKGSTSNSVGNATGTPRGLNEKVDALERFWGNIDSIIRSNTNAELTLKAINLRFPLYNQAGLVSVS